ncbi:collagen binding domain-containing protein [Bacillus sp. Bva_UNVM-123]|uniref:collagen binding domain-containing protein n=1 Tax=Bacillus sp. Bva_UNVM-123 TaxID=2829798 RepID=UPI00391F3801
MKKLSIITLMVLLVLNSFLGSLQASANTDVSSQSFTLGEAQIDAGAADETKVKVKFNWLFTAGEKETEEIYTFHLPSEVKLEAEQSGDLTIDGEKIGSYKASLDGTITVTILPGKTVSGVGSLEFLAVKAIAAEKQIEEEATKTEDETEATEGNKAEIEEGKTELEKETDVKKQTKATMQAASTEITKNILTDAVLSFEDKNGNPITGVDRESIIAVNYKWALEDGHGYKAGATFKFNLPPELKVYEEVTNEPLKFGADTLGTFTVNKNGQVTVIFNDFIENHSNISGTMEVLSKISETVVVTEDKIVKVTPIQDGVSKNIPIIFHPNGSTIDKNGIPNRAYNTETIEWTVNFNKSLETIKNAVLSDPIQNGQELRAGSIKVYKLITRLDGSVTLGDELTTGFTIGKTDGQDFEISFENDISTAYRVVYTTEITDQNGTKFDNKAILSGAGFTSKEATASVGVKRGVALAKTSAHYDEAKQTITWEIKYNYNEKSIVKANALLKDYFNNTQELVDNSIEVRKITIDADGKESGPGVVVSNYTVTQKSKGNQNGFELQFNQDIEEAYKITYKTKAINRVFDGVTITNEVEAVGIEKTTGTRDIYQQILYKSNFKDYPKTDYGKKTTTWGISFNVDSYLMKNVKLVDTFPNKGLTLIPETLKITSQGKELVEGTDYKFTNKGENGFEIEFLNDIDKPHYIEYQTNFNYDLRDDKSTNFLNNKASMTWMDESNSTKSKESTATFTPDTYTQANGFKNGSYNAVTKEITWNIGINYNLKTLEKASVVDEIQGDQVMDKNSLKVFKMILTGGANGTKQEEAVENSDYEVVWNPTGQPGFKVNFLKEIDSAYLIEYQTSLKDQLIVDKYANKATLYNDTEKVTDLNASVSVPNGGKYTGKSGEQKGKIIDWAVNINFGQSKVSNAKVIDKPSENQLLLEQSFHLYSTTVAKNGTVTKSLELKQGEDYTLEFINDGFELAFKGEIDKPYILEYQSLILAKVGDTVNNEIHFTGDQITTEVTQSKSTLTVKRTTGLGTGTGEVGSLEVNKVDANDSEKFLEGATFTLIDETTGVIIKTLTTGTDGKVKFDKLLYGEYVLKEDKAPEGYVVGIDSTNPLIVNVGDPKITKDKVTSVTIKNAKIHQAVELTKLDKDDKTLFLQGAEFELQREDNGDFVKVSTHMTNEDGKIIINNLEPGDYQFIETKAPDITY